MQTERVAMVSDSHGNLPALDAVVAETADRLMALAWPTIAGGRVGRPQRELVRG